MMGSGTEQAKLWPTVMSKPFQIIFISHVNRDHLSGTTAFECTKSVVGYSSIHILVERHGVWLLYKPDKSLLKAVSMPGLRWTIPLMIWACSPSHLEWCRLNGFHNETL